MIKNLSNVSWNIWKDDPDFLKFVKEQSMIFKPTKVCEKIKEEFNLDISPQVLGAVKRINNIFVTRKRNDERWKKGLSIEEAFKEKL